MSDAFPVVYLARHGETAWTISGQHTGATDLPLTARGEAEATQLAEPLAGLMFAAVFTSPLQRAVQTCELAGFGPVAEVEPDLVEWNYGTYEGRTSAEIRAERPDWQVFAARWLGLEPGAGRYFLLGTASLSALGYEHDRSEPVIRLWNERPHEGRADQGQVRGHEEKAWR